MKSTLSQCATSLWETVKAPVIRHECDRHYGLYRNKNASSPLASFDIRRDSDIPLCKLIVIVGIVVTACVVIKKKMSHKHRRHCTCTCMDYNSADGN